MIMIIKILHTLIKRSWKILWKSDLKYHIWLTTRFHHWYQLMIYVRCCLPRCWLDWFKRNYTTLFKLFIHHKHQHYCTYGNIVRSVSMLMTKDDLFPPITNNYKTSNNRKCPKCKPIVYCDHTGLRDVSSGTNRGHGRIYPTNFC